MATLKGQNFRVMGYIGTSLTCLAAATNCSITLNNNTDNASTKDDVGLAQKPVTISKSWQIQVDAMDVSDTAALLAMIKSHIPFLVMWDETETTDNQTRALAAFSRQGMAYISDATFTFNDRENCAKQVTLIGTGKIDAANGSSATQTSVNPPASITKGQNIRLFLSSDNTTAPAKVIAAARQLQLHVSLSMENVTTKDTTGDWQVQEPTELSYDITTSALMRSGEEITSQVAAQALADVETIYENGTPVKWKIANTGGANNRTASSTIASGSVVLTQLQLNGQNRANADYQATLTGYGEYEVA